MIVMGNKMENYKKKKCPYFQNYGKHDTFVSNTSEPFGGCRADKTSIYYTINK